MSLVLMDLSAQDYEACTWQTDLDSAGDNTNLMKIADGLSNDVTMMENSFMHLAVPGKQPSFYPPMSFAL